MSSYGNRRRSSRASGCRPEGMARRRTETRTRRPWSSVAVSEIRQQRLRQRLHGRARRRNGPGPSTRSCGRCRRRCSARRPGHRAPRVRANVRRRSDLTLLFAAPQREPDRPARRHGRTRRWRARPRAPCATPVPLSCAPVAKSHESRCAPTRIHSSGRSRPRISASDVVNRHGAGRDAVAKIERDPDHSAIEQPPDRSRIVAADLRLRQRAEVGAEFRASAR